jgi:hypothetical protein
LPDIESKKKENISSQRLYQKSKGSISNKIFFEKNIESKIKKPQWITAVVIPLMKSRSKTQQEKRIFSLSVGKRKKLMIE